MQINKNNVKYIHRWVSWWISLVLNSQIISWYVSITVPTEHEAIIQQCCTCMMSARKTVSLVLNTQAQALSNAAHAWCQQHKKQIQISWIYYNYYFITQSDLMYKSTCSFQRSTQTIYCKVGSTSMVGTVSAVPVFNSPNHRWPT